MSARMEVATDCWNGVVPDWVQALVNACDAKASSQNKVACRLGLSGAVVSQTIRNSYQGNKENIEERVRAIFMAGLVDCPSLGEIGTEDCLKYRDDAAELVSASPNKVRMFAACNRCPRHLKNEGAEI
jgi:DNA-binding transcriptional regulator YdaS (Cro superfamily)